MKTENLITQHPITEAANGVQIPVQFTTHSRLDEMNLDELEFGKYISDHMLVADYANGKWGTPRVIPYSDLSLSPSTLALHYGQTVFEGMKAFHMKDGSINIFRIDRHYERFVRSLERMCMAVVPKKLFTESIMKLVEVDKKWVPAKQGSALYIRPFMYASEAKFGVKVSEQYRFVIFTGPVPSLYANPIRLKVETHYIRAAKGGTGFAKCGGNYGGAFYPTQQARKEGYDQVLWTNACDNKYVEESGMMNVMFVIDGILVTPPLSDSILDGITRDSLLTIAKDLGIEVQERPVALLELEKAFADGKLSEAFGVGTAALVAPVKTIHINGTDYDLPVYQKDALMFKLKQKLEEIRTGYKPDVYGWNNVLTEN
jgi:branched-chain amino acid aminotransferase